MDAEGGRRSNRGPAGWPGRGSNAEEHQQPSCHRRNRHPALVLPSGQVNTRQGWRTCEDCGLKEEAARQRVARLKLRAAAAAGRHRALGQCILHLGLNLCSQQAGVTTQAASHLQ